MRLWRLRTTGLRSTSQWAVLSVVAAVALVCTTLIAGLSLLVATTERVGLSSALSSAPDLTTRLELTFGLLPEGQSSKVVAGSDRAAADAFRGLPTTSGISITSRFQRIDTAAAKSVLTYFAADSAFARRARLTSGHWPGAPTENAEIDSRRVRVIPVAVPEKAMGASGWRLGDRIPLSELDNQQSGAVVEIVGVYSATDVTDPSWTADALSGGGYAPAFTVPGRGGFTLWPAYGPLVVDPETFHTAAPGATPQAAEMRAWYTPDLSSVRAEDLVPLVNRIYAADEQALQATTGSIRSIDLHSDLPGLLLQSLGSLTITRGSVIVVGLLLLVLGMAALLQTARLLAESRVSEQQLMRARGASGRQLWSLATIEAVALATATAATAPPLARWLYVRLARHSDLAAADMGGDPGSPTITWYVAGAVSLVFAGVLVSPLLRRSTTFARTERARARPGRLTAMQRSGLDLGIVALAGLAFWQLTSYRTPMMAGATYWVDPVLASGPALVLLAGALLCVRAIPAASRVIERLAARGRGIVGPLAAWEIGRRSARTSSAILLLTLSLAVGTFAQSFVMTWRTSQADQVDFLHPPTVRVTATTLDPLQQSSSLAALDATAEPAAVLNRTGGLGNLDSGPDGIDTRNEAPAQAIGFGSGALSQITASRVDAEGGTRLKRFVASGIETDQPGSLLPGRPTALRATAWVAAPSDLPNKVAVRLSALVESADGLVQSIDLGVVPCDNAKHEIEGSLVSGADARAHPVGVRGLRLVGFQADFTMPPVSDRVVGQNGLDIGIAHLRAVEPSGGATTASGTDAVSETPLGSPGTAAWSTYHQGFKVVSPRPPAGAALGVSQLVADREANDGPVSRIVSVPWHPVKVRALVTPALLRSVGGKVGSELGLKLDGTVIPVTVTGVIEHVPGSDPHADAVVVDLRELSRAFAQAGEAEPLVDEWWLNPPADSAAAVGRTITAEKLGAVSLRAAVLRDRTSGPMTVGTPSALWLVTLAAGLLAAAGFALHTAVTIRARETEFAQLRAVGLYRRSLTGVVAVETLLISLVGGTFGIGLGTALSRLLGPLVGFSDDGRPPFPTVVVGIPWDHVGLLAAEVVALLALVVTVVAQTMRFADPATTLRFGDER